MGHSMGYDSLQKKVSLVMVTWNKQRILEKHLIHIGHHRDAFYEMVLVDNGSSDGTVSMVENKFPWISLLRLPTNIGPMGARNIGAINTKGGFLLFLDDDGYFDFYSLRTMLERFEEDETLGVLSGKVVNIPDLDVYTLNFDDYRVKEPRVYYSYTYKAGIALMRKKAFFEAGMLADYFFYGCEERDLACRLFKKEYKVMIFDGAVMLHQKVVDAAANRRFYSLHYRNRLFQIWRSLPIGPALLESLLTIGAGFAGGLATGNLLAFFKGVFRGLGRLPLVLLHERDPMSRPEYRIFKEMCGMELLPSKRISGLRRNIAAQKGRRSSSRRQGLGLFLVSFI